MISVFKPLPLEDFALYMLNRSTSLEEEQYVVEYMLPNLEAGKDPAFHSMWVGYDSGNPVTELVLKGDPVGGSVEIGYHTLPAHRRKGYMTEAVGRIISWAKDREDIDCLWASIEPDNVASIKAVEYNGFEKMADNIWKINV